MSGIPNMSAISCHCFGLFVTPGDGNGICGLTHAVSKKAGFKLSREMFCAPLLMDMVKYLYAFLRS